MICCASEVHILRAPIDDVTCDVTGLVEDDALTVMDDVSDEVSIVVVEVYDVGIAVVDPELEACVSLTVEVACGVAVLVLDDELVSVGDTMLVLAGLLVTPPAADDVSDEVPMVVIEEDVIGTDGVEVELDTSVLLTVVVSRKIDKEKKSLQINAALSRCLFLRPSVDEVTCGVTVLAMDDVLVSVAAA